MIRGQIFAKPAPLRPRAPFRQTTLPIAAKALTDTMKNIHTRIISKKTFIAR